MVKVNDVFLAYMVSQISHCCSNLFPTPFPFDSLPLSGSGIELRIEKRLLFRFRSLIRLIYHFTKKTFYKIKFAIYCDRHLTLLQQGVSFMTVPVRNLCICISFESFILFTVLWYFLQSSKDFWSFVFTFAPSLWTF